MNQILLGDNLEILRRKVDADSVDLIYLDPPFNSGADYRFSADAAVKRGHMDADAAAKRAGAEAASDAASSVASDAASSVASDAASEVAVGADTGARRRAERAFRDIWRWDADTRATYDNALATLSSAEAVAFLRGARDFLGEGAVLAYLTFMAPRLAELHRVLAPDGTLYLHTDAAAGHALKLLLDALFGADAFRNEIVWCYSGGATPRRDFPRKHDVILRYTKGARWTFHRAFKPYKENTQQVGRHSTYAKEGQRAIDLARGTPLTDWWADIPTVTGWNPERSGYPTQKPLALLRRIVETSSNPGDLVLDPFCGSGTTLVAAAALGRRWLGIDCSPQAAALARARMRDSRTVPADDPT